MISSSRILMGEEGKSPSFTDNGSKSHSGLPLIAHCTHLIGEIDQRKAMKGKIKRWRLFCSWQVFHRDSLRLRDPGHQQP